MKVLYTAPNRAHHYRYASALAEANSLASFVSGFSRFSSLAQPTELSDHIVRADLLQNVYLASLRIGSPVVIQEKLAYWAKIEQDLACSSKLPSSDVFLFYNGSGLISCRKAKSLNILTVVEAVNSHVLVQERILRNEHHHLGIPWRPFDRSEVKRRLAEYEEADRILVPSEFARRSFLEEGYAEGKLIKVNYGFDNPPLRRGTVDRTAGKKFTVLYVGSISVRKGLRYLVEAFRALNYANKQLVIVGPKSQPSGLENMQLTDDICFTGPLKGNALQEAYDNASVFCLPTLEDGFGLVLGEAMSAGLPVIATVNSGGPDLVTHREDGFLVPICNSAEITMALQYLADNPEDCRNMGEKARLKSGRFASWPIAGKNLVSALTNALEKHSSRT